MFLIPPGDGVPYLSFISSVSSGYPKSINLELFNPHPMNGVLGRETSIRFSSFRSIILFFVFQLNLYLNINHRHSLTATFLCHILFFWECCRSFTVEEQYSDKEFTKEWQQQTMSGNWKMRNVFQLEITVLDRIMSLYHCQVDFDIFYIIDNSLSLSSSFLKDGFLYKKTRHSNGFTTSKSFQWYTQTFFIKSKCRNYIFIQILNKTSNYIYPKMYLLMEHWK